ncbi:MAG TPA: hypothetical protein VFZ61_04265 [Polyangiales bacterium]
MGLDYRFHLVFPVAAADAALRALAQELRPEDHRRLVAALPWHAANARVTSWRGSPIWERSGILSLARRDEDRADAFCFQLQVHGDAADARAEAATSARANEAPCARAACWTSIGSGGRLFVISATPVDQELRRACETSAALLAPWQRVASGAGAHALFLDTEPQRPRKLLYPEPRAAPRPACSDYELSDQSIATDAYWCASLEQAGISLPPLSSPPRSPDCSQTDT